MTQRTLPRLSEDTILALKSLREEDKGQFVAYVKALRLNSWPLKAIGDACDVSKTAVSNWEKAADAAGLTDLPEVEQMPKVPVVERTVATEKTPLTQNQSQELRELTQEASKVRRFTDPNAPSRRAAERLEELIEEYIESGVTVTDIAEACGVSRSAIAQRRRKEKN